MFVDIVTDIQEMCRAFHRGGYQSWYVLDYVVYKLDVFCYVINS